MLERVRLTVLIPHIENVQAHSLPAHRVQVTKSFKSVIGQVAILHCFEDFLSKSPLGVLMYGEQVQSPRKSVRSGIHACEDERPGTSITVNVEERSLVQRLTTSER